MNRFFAAVLVAVAVFAQPAAAQTSSERQQVLQVQALIGDVGRWMQEYMAAVAPASQPLVEIQTYVDILDRFNAGDLRQSRAREEIRAWRTRSLALVQQSRAAAEALRSPPSLAMLGEEGVTLEGALRGARDNALPTIAELERIINACADLGLEAISDTAKGFELRQRTLVNAQMQLVRVDLNRVNLAVASVNPRNPTHHISIATQHYYAAMLVVGELALAELDGGGDRGDVIASMRQSGRDMREALAQSSARAEAMQAQLRAGLGGPGVEIARTGLRVFETYPPTIAAYQGLAENIDRAATALENDEEVLDVWSNQEVWDTPHLNEIDRLDRVRAELLANNAGTL